MSQETSAEQPAGSRLDPHLARYAQRTRSMTASEIRALFAVASRPEVVSLAGGMPNLAALPLDSLGEMLREMTATRGTVALQYGSGQGDERLREQICEVMALEGITAHPDDVVVTVGSQQALDLVARIFLDPADVVLAEAPSYVGALGTFAAYQARVVHVAMDADGLVPDALRATLASLAARGVHPKLLYTVPNHHNPMGVSLAAERRLEVLDIADRAGVLVLEDNPYGLLGFDGSTHRALRAEDARNVVYLGTFSKTFAPGLRVGWALAPHGVRERLVLASEASILCPSAFSQLVVSTYLDRTPWLEQVKSFREMYRERRDAMLESLAAVMPPGTRWTRPEGGFYVWLTLPDGLDSKALLPRAVSARVAYVPGTAFYADGTGGEAMRLSYCFPSPERIRDGVHRLAGAIQAETELVDTFGASGRGAPDATAPAPDTV
ncbi:MAG: aminotransferase-like domain-containing protein [Actinomycetes bacterium]